MNIILLVSDTFRYDNLFDRADMPVATPNLDAFSARSVSLSRLYTGSFPTIPHRTDLTSGRFGWPWYPWQDRRSSTKNHAPEILAEAGYVTQLLCDCPHLFPAAFPVGFHAAHQVPGQEGSIYVTRMNYPIEHRMPPEKTRAGKHFQGANLADLSGWINMHWQGETDCFPPRTAELAVRWLEENYLHHPLFLWVDFFDPHEPWDPPEYMVRKYDRDYDGPPMLHPNYGRADDYTPAELNNLRAHYCAEAEMVDRWVGRIIKKIDDLAMWDNSIVVFTTDHGMSLGEHNRTGKSNINPGDDRFWPIYPEIAHIPLMIAAPGLEGGRRVDSLIQPPDILPTLMDLAGVEVEPPEPFHGCSFADILRGGGGLFRDVAIAGCHMRLREGSVPAQCVTPVVYTGDWAYVPIGPAGERELFDLGADPYGLTNVAADNAAVADELHSRLLGWLRAIDAPPGATAPFE